MCGADRSTVTVAIIVNNVKTIKQNLEVEKEAKRKERERKKTRHKINWNMKYRMRVFCVGPVNDSAVKRTHHTECDLVIKLAFITCQQP